LPTINTIHVCINATSGHKGWLINVGKKMHKDSRDKTLAFDILSALQSNPSFALQFKTLQFISAWMHSI